MNGQGQIFSLANCQWAANLRSRLRRKRSILSAIICSLLPCAGCGGGGDANDRYYLISANIQLPYWQAAAAGFLEAAKRRKLQAEFVGPETYDPKAQQLEFERIVKTKPNGILISPANPDLMKADIDAAVAAGVPVLTMDADSPNSKRLLFIGTNNYQAGVMGAKVAAKELHGKGNVVVLTIPAMANLGDRLRGYRDTFAAYPGIKITRIIDIAGNPRVAAEATEQILSKEKDKVDAFLCLEAVAGNAVAEVLDHNNVKGKIIVAMDSDNDTLSWIKKGVIAATIAQKPFTMSYVGLSLLENLHHSPPASWQENFRANPLAPLPSFIDTGAILVDRNSVDAFLSSQKPRAASGT